MILYEAILGIPPPQRLATENYEFVPARWVGGLPADVPPGLWDLLCECVSMCVLCSSNLHPFLFSMCFRHSCLVPDPFLRSC